MSDHTCVVFWPRGLSAAAAHGIHPDPAPADDSLPPTPVKAPRPAAASDAADGDEEYVFLVGWNPRGVVLCVADAVVAPSYRAALAFTERLSIADPAAAKLRVLGQLLRPGSQRSGQCRAASQAADLWVELHDGPRMADMFICGYRHRVPLFLVEFDPAVRYSTAPVTLNATARLTLADVHRAVAGQPATHLVVGARSVLEGPFLAPHCNTLGRRPASALEAEGQDMAANDSITSAKEGRDASPVAASHDGTSALSDTDAQPFGAALLPVDPGTLDPVRPPRLEFPRAATATELCRVLSHVNATRRVQRLIGSGTAPARRRPFAEPLRPVANTAVRCLKPVLVALSAAGRLSSAAGGVELRVREAVAAASLLAGGPYCGLHPFLPYALADDPDVAAGQARRSLNAFAARVMIDVVLGLAVASLLAWSQEPLSDALRRWAQHALFDMHLQYFEWFLGWPAGFKLNGELSAVCSAVSRGGIRGWGRLQEVGVDWVAVAVRALLLAAPLGLSVMLHVAADVCNLWTLHLRLLFYVLAVPYRAVTSVVSTLTLQLRGKRLNPLRRRVDEWVFAADEVVLGTVACTVAVFLLPTIAMYFLYLAMVRAAACTLQEGFRAAATITAHLPAYNLYLWLFHGGRLPSGVVFRSVSGTTAPAPDLAAAKQPDSPRANVEPTVLRLEVQRLGLGAALHEFLLLCQFCVASVVAASAALLRSVKRGVDRPVVDFHTLVFPHLLRDPARPELARGA